MSRIERSSLNASGFIDPMITFDPNFDSSGLSLQFSSGILNASAAPGPSNWAMLLLGFCGLGFLAHRRRNALRVA